MSVMKDSKKAAQLFKALAHPSRIQIVEELLHGEKCVLEIKDLLSISQPNISQHLNILKYSGVVDFRKQGSLRCYYLLEPERMRTLLETAGS